jgi:hypothetical protein
MSAEEGTMKKILRSFFIIFCFFATFLLIIPNVISQEKTIIKKGDYFPKLSLEPPVESKHLPYLGIDEGKRFTLNDVNADFILVDIMNTYCSGCRKQAPINNKLYSLIESTAGTKGRIKMFAIAVGCLDVYIKQFIENFNTLYPVIQDPKFVVYDAIGRSPLPLTIFIRPDPKTGESIVVGTHCGFDSDYKGMFNEIQGLMNADLAIIRDEGKKLQAKVVEVKPILSDRELQERIQMAFAEEGDRISSFKTLNLPSGRTVYTSIVQQNMEKKYLFAVMVSRSPPCDVCHDVHFIYVFEATGKILQLIPLQLTKYANGNEPWDNMDVEKMRKRVIGRYLHLPFDFDPEIDAVTSATITCSVIFKSLEEEQSVLKELEEKGLLQSPNDSSNLTDR